MTKVTLTRAQQLLAIRSGFTTRTGLSADRFYRLSPDPIWTGGMTLVEKNQLLAARKINEDHYMPYCGKCGGRVEWDHTQGGVRTWVHKQAGADHVPDQTSHPNSYNDHPDGLAYVVWSGTDVLAWVTNSGRVTYPASTTHPKHRQLVREILGEQS